MTGASPRDESRGQQRRLNGAGAPTQRSGSDDSTGRERRLNGAGATTQGDGSDDSTSEGGGGPGDLDGLGAALPCPEAAAAGRQGLRADIADQHSLVG